VNGMIIAALYLQHSQPAGAVESRV
jgi:hypothetical protein